MSPKVMIIDGQRDFRRLLKHHVTVRWPDARISEYDPGQSGALPDGFSGADSDVVLLGDNPGAGEAGATLARFLKTPGFPPVVYFGVLPESGVPGTDAGLARDRISHAALIARLEAILATEHPGAAKVRGHVDGRDTATMTTVKGYRLQRQLAAGEHTRVYFAIKDETGAEVALKVLREVPDIGDGERVLDRFLQEFEIIAELKHANVVRIFDLGISDDQAFLAMEYLPGGDLRQKLKTGIKEAEALGFCRQISSALANLHAVGILHRDLKPGNIMLRADGSIALIDFGMAKRMHQAMEKMGDAAIFGTPHYMSPEQGRGNPVDERSDLYSLGIILHEMLTGTRPFQGSDPMKVLFKHAEAPLPVLPAHLGRYQPILDKLLAKKPDDRFQGAGEVLEWL